MSAIKTLTQHYHGLSQLPIRLYHCLLQLIKYLLMAGAILTGWLHLPLCKAANVSPQPGSHSIAELVVTRPFEFYFRLGNDFTYRRYYRALSQMNLATSASIAVSYFLFYKIQSSAASFAGQLTGSGLAAGILGLSSAFILPEMAKSLTSRLMGKRFGSEQIQINDSTISRQFYLELTYEWLTNSQRLSITPFPRAFIFYHPPPNKDTAFSEFDLWQSFYEEVISQRVERIELSWSGNEMDAGIRIQLFYRNGHYLTRTVKQSGTDRMPNTMEALIANNLQGEKQAIGSLLNELVIERVVDLIRFPNQPLTSIPASALVNSFEFDGQGYSGRISLCTGKRSHCGLHLDLTWSPLPIPYFRPTLSGRQYRDNRNAIDATINQLTGVNKAEWFVRLVEQQAIRSMVSTLLDGRKARHQTGTGPDPAQPSRGIASPENKAAIVPHSHPADGGDTVNMAASGLSSPLWQTVSGISAGKKTGLDILEKPATSTRGSVSSPSTSVSATSGLTPEQSKTHYIFTTGGCVSGLGKGVISASTAALLKARGLKVTLIKVDPYLNVDSGTMNPGEHGEVYVTNDGAETDLDLGHYERFTGNEMGERNAITTGKLMLIVQGKERRGEYQGKTVQATPHGTETFEQLLVNAAGDADIAIVEIGGTVGDMELGIYLEAIRQMKYKLGPKRMIHMHVSPIVKIIGAYKTKPTQHSLRETGKLCGWPDILICRASSLLDESVRDKMVLHSNMERKMILLVPDVDTIYSVPLVLHKQELDQIVSDRFKLDTPKPNLWLWKDILNRYKSSKKEVSIAMVGKYLKQFDAYKSLIEAIGHAGLNTYTQVNIKYVDPEALENGEAVIPESASAILVPGGFGKRGIEGKILAICHARENGIPYLGICLGMQLAVVEYARNVAGLEGAHSSEFDKQTPHPVVSLISEWVANDGSVQSRTESSDLGGTMRLGAYSCVLKEDSKIHSAYNDDIISERHRHRYEVNNHYREPLEAAGMLISGYSEDNALVEIIELPDHPWFVACQFHPEFKSTPFTGHPLIKAFIRAAQDYQEESSQVGVME